MKALGDREGDVRKTAAMSLARFEEAKWESLVHGDPGDLARLGNSGDLRAVEPLIKALGEWDSDSRQVAAEVLGKLRDARAIEPLIKALGDADSDLRKAASEALNNLGQPKWKNVIRGDNDDWTRLGATANPVAVEALIKCLSYGCGNHTADSSKNLRLSAARGLVQVAAAAPGLLRANWKKVAGLVREPHRDEHSEETGSSDCWYGRHSHRDTGIGLDFPEPPPISPQCQAKDPGLRTAENLAFPCPNCGKKLKAPGHLAGHSACCPGCKTTFQIPAQPDTRGNVKRDF